MPDLVAGPTEILVIADGHAAPFVVAVDLLSRAEHRPDSPAILITDSEPAARETIAHIERLQPGMPPRDLAAPAWQDHGQVIVTADLTEADGTASAPRGGTAPVTIRVLLADDQAVVVGTFRILIDLSEDFDVVGVAANGQEAVDLARATHPDVVVMDIRMPVLDGLAATAEITADQTLRATKVLVLTTFKTDEYVAEAIRAGASGFLGKGIGPEELLAGIRTVAGGDALLSPAATRALISRFLAAPEASEPTAQGADALPELTAREREVVAEVAGGLSNDEIAEKLYVSPLTVRSHVQRAIAKLDVRDRAQLVVRAYQSGLVRASHE